MYVRSAPRSRSGRAARRAVGTAAEMRNLFSELLEACDNILLFAERIDPYDEVFDHVDEMPQFPDVPEGGAQESWLRKEGLKGPTMRYGAPVPQSILNRFETEMTVAYATRITELCPWNKAAVRTVSEPRTNRPAGCGPRLRRPSARPDDPLRTEKYGDEYTAMVNTFGKIGSGQCRRRRRRRRRPMATADGGTDKDVRDDTELAEAADDEE